MGHHQRNIIVNGNSVLMDQTQPPPPLIEQNICFCSKFLNPFSNSFGNNHCLVTPNNLQHYCRVCNIQLNSCRQAKIHSEGKKHDKRLSYLRFCLESSDTSAGVAFLQNGSSSAPSMDTPPPNSIFPATIQNGAANTQPLPVPGQITAPQQQPLSVVQSATQQPPPSAVPPPPTGVQQPCNIPPPPGTIYTGYASLPPPLPGTSSLGQGPQLPPPPSVMPQSATSTIPMACSSSSMVPASIYQQAALPSVVTTTTPYFYPQATTTSVAGTPVAAGALGYHSLPPPIQHQTTYYDYAYIAPMVSADGNIGAQSTTSQMAPAPMHHNQPPPLPPPPAAVNMNVFPSSNNSLSNNNTYTTNTNGQVIFHCNVMSPSLTSGFSGSGGDCKSTETSSILSTASFSSTAMHYNNHHHNQHKKKTCNTGSISNVDKMNNNISHSGGNAGNNDVRINEKGFIAICELCRLPFPSQAVLENHLRGSRHARRVKSQQAFKQLHDNGAVFRQEEGVSEIRCEVCRVSVNSSHQLQAHLLGHKHRARAVRRGVKPNQAIINLSSSTDVTTTSPSGASSVSGNESPPSQAASGQQIQQQQQQQPKHQKQKQQKQSQQLQQVSVQGVSTSGSLQRRRRSSAFIVPLGLSGPTSSSSITTTIGSISHTTALSRRHRSSGCLSKHCSHSTLSLSNPNFSQHRARSSSALNKMHSRSMNLLMLHTGGLTQSIRQDDSSSTDEGFDRDDRRKVKQRPRSYSTRTTKEGEAGATNRNDKGSVQTQQHQPEGKSFSQRRSKSIKNYNVEHHVNGVLNGFIVKGQHSEKQQPSRHQKNLNKQQLAAASSDQKCSSSLSNLSNRRTANHNSNSTKTSKSSVVAPQSLGNVQSTTKTNNASTSKKLKNIPMLGVFLEGLNNNGHHFHGGNNNKKNNQTITSPAASNTTRLNNNSNNNNNNNSYTQNKNSNTKKITSSCENKKKQAVIEKAQLTNGISTNGVTENTRPSKVVA